MTVSSQDSGKALFHSNSVGRMEVKLQFVSQTCHISSSSRIKFASNILSKSKFFVNRKEIALKRISKYLAVILAFCAILVLFGCSDDSKTDSTFFRTDTKYEIGLKIDTFETKGTLTLYDDKVHFLHTSESSSLFGMEEIASKDGYEARFQGIVWESNEINPSAKILYRIFDVIRSNDAVGTEEGVIREREGFKHTYSAENIHFALWVDKSNGNPIQIIGKAQNNEFEINFML